MAIRCCSRPHGNAVFFPIIFVTIAVILTNAANRWCDFATYTGTQVSELVLPLNQVNTVLTTGVGIWDFENPTDLNGDGKPYCYYYPKKYFAYDRKFKSARVFSVWTPLVGGIIMIMLWFSACVPYKKSAWAGMSFLLFLNTLFEGLILLIFRSEFCSGVSPVSGIPNRCTMNYGARCCVAALFFWFFGACSIAFVPPPKFDRMKDVVVQERRTTTTTTNPDGSRVVTKQVDRVLEP